jgi:pleiotropic regulator 1
MYLWDWLTGYNFQRIQSAAQSGSIDSEMGIFALTFDQSGSRLLTCEADKTIKIYKEDETAVNILFLCSLIINNYIMFFNLE